MIPLIIVTLIFLIGTTSILISIFFENNDLDQKYDFKKNKHKHYEKNEFEDFMELEKENKYRTKPAKTSPKNKEDFFDDLDIYIDEEFLE